MQFVHSLTVLSIPTVIAVCLASLVEFIEALTIVLAVAIVGGWRNATLGALAAVATLAVIVAIAGPILLHINIQPLQIIAGLALLIFGARWLRKAILRGAGKLAMHDEAKIYEKEVGALTSRTPRAVAGFDISSAGTAFNGVLVEGLEVVFIIVAAGATAKGLVAASLGAAIALAVVAILGLVLRRPITQVPENTLKLVVAIMLCGLGIYWLGEGLGLNWPGGMWMSLILAAAFLTFALITIQVLKGRPDAPPPVASR
jgi:uncharacterized membrane protein